MYSLCLKNFLWLDQFRDTVCPSDAKYWDEIKHIMKKKMKKKELTTYSSFRTSRWLMEDLTRVSVCGATTWP